MNFEKLINEFGLQDYIQHDDYILKVNAHIHSPYSFSAFNSINEAVDLASKEGVKILGINDFYTTDGYSEFYNACFNNRVYPLFNIEFIGLDKDFQKLNIRVNDPNNPGRVYFSGKGLKYPFHLDHALMQKLSRIQDESIVQVRQMIEKANFFFTANNIDLKLDFEEIKSNYAKNLVRERHIAKAIRIAIAEKFESEEDKKTFLKQLYSGKETVVNVNDNNALENEIRGMLLKSGGAAFVEEDENAFLSLNEIIELIINAGGIPCYPVLLDDKNGNFTDFEGDWDKMHEELLKINVRCIELIPGRNSLEILEQFVKFFDSKDYVILFGTEHNTPDLIPLTVSCRKNVPLTDYLQKVSFEGACVIAAHQFLHLNAKEGYIRQDGGTNYEYKNGFIKFGKALIKKTYS